MTPNSNVNKQALAKAILNMTWGDLEDVGKTIGENLVSAREEMIASAILDELKSGIAGDLHAWAECVLED